MFGIGGFELFLIIFFAFLIFGPDKLPEIANTVGKAIAKFKNAKDEMTGSLNAKSFLSDDPDQPIKNPIEVLEQATAAMEAKKNAKAVGSGSSVGDAISSSQPKKPGSAVEKYPTFAERKAAYERERAAKKAVDGNSGEDAPSADSVPGEGGASRADSVSGAGRVSRADSAPSAGSVKVSSGEVE